MKKILSTVYTILFILVVTSCTTTPKESSPVQEKNAGRDLSVYQEVRKTYQEGEPIDFSEHLVPYSSKTDEDSPVFELHRLTLEAASDEVLSFFLLYVEQYFGDLEFLTVALPILYDAGYEDFDFIYHLYWGLVDTAVKMTDWDVLKYPFIVLSVDEEYDFLDQYGITYISQSTMENDAGTHFDYFAVVPNDNWPFTGIFFNVDILFSQYDDIFGDYGDLKIE